MNYKAMRATSIIFGFTSAIGTVVTALLVAKETPKALIKIKELKSKDNSRKIDYIKELLPIYWPAITVCAGTIASTTISNVISMKTEASLIATSTMLSQSLRRYKGKVKDILGIDADKLISTEIAKDDYDKLHINNLKIEPEEKLYWEENLGFFKCKPIDFMAAIADLNQRLHTPDPSPDGTFYFTTLYILMKDAKAKVYDEEKLDICKNWGWTTDYLCEVYDMKCMWVHAHYTNVIDKNTGEVLFTKISFFEEPIYLEDSEISRYKYISRKEYEHNNGQDMHDYDAFQSYLDNYDDPYDENDENVGSKIAEIQEEFINSKIDCDCKDDDGRRFIPSNPNFSKSNKYSTGEDVSNPDSKLLFDSNLPDIEDIPDDKS